MESRFQDGETSPCSWVLFLFLFCFFKHIDKPYFSFVELWSDVSCLYQRRRKDVMSPWPLDLIPSCGAKGEGAFYGRALGQNCFIFWVGRDLTREPIEYEDNNDETQGWQWCSEEKLSSQFFLLLIKKKPKLSFFNEKNHVGLLVVQVLALSRLGQNAMSCWISLIDLYYSTRWAPCTRKGCLLSAELKLLQ